MKKICGHCGNQRLTHERRDELIERAREINSMGAEDFKLKWITANQKATNAALELGLDVTDPRIRALIQLVLYRTMKSFPEAKKNV